MTLFCAAVAAALSLRGQDAFGWGISAFFAPIFDIPVLFILTGGLQ